MVVGVCAFACTETRTLDDATEWQQLDPTDLEQLLDPVAIALPEPAFAMGNDQDLDERPRHQVALTNPIVSMRTEVTQQLYQQVMEVNPSFFQRCGETCPVEKVRWIETIEFSNRVNQILGLQQCYEVQEQGHVEWTHGYECNGWRLPTEAEWEWIASSGRPKGHILNKYAWFSDNSNTQTHPVCSRTADLNGLCDVLGNVQEWVWDVAEGYPSSHPERARTNPMGPAEGKHHVFRGGAWNRYGENLTEFIRKDAAYLFRNNDLGFRLVRTTSVK